MFSQLNHLLRALSLAFARCWGGGGMCGPSRLLWEGTENKPFLQPGESIYLEVVGEQMDGFS